MELIEFYDRDGKRKFGEVMGRDKTGKIFLKVYGKKRLSKIDKSKLVKREGK